MRKKFANTILAALWLFALIASGSVVHAQESITSPWGLELGAGAGMNFQTGIIGNIPGFERSPNASPYESGSGFGLSFHGALHRVFSPRIGAGLRLAYNTHNATLESEEFTFIAPPSGIIPATIAHEVAATIRSISLEPYFELGIGGRWSMSFGAQFAYLTQGTFVQSETLSDPPGAVFLDGSATHANGAGDLPGLRRLQLSGALGIAYTAPLSASAAIVPQARLNYGFTDIATDLDWQTIRLRIGIGVRFGVFDDEANPPPAPRDTVYQRDTLIRVTAPGSAENVVLVARTFDPESSALLDNGPIVIRETYRRLLPKPLPLLQANIESTFFLADGTEADAVALSVKRIVETRHMPLLPYIFFERRSAGLPRRYRMLSGVATSEFNEPHTAALPGLAPYNHILNIIGRRLRDNPKSGLTLTGCVNHSGNKRNDTTLARERASAIQRYLTSVWHIRPDRLHIAKAKVFSILNEDEPLRAERRCVELTSDDKAILAPLITYDTLQTVTPPIIRFYPSAIYETGPDRWKIRIADNRGRVVKTIRGEGEPPEYIEWDIDGDHNDAIRAETKLWYTLVIDAEGQRDSTQPAPIEFSYTSEDSNGAPRLDMRTERYSLVLFDFDRAEVSGRDAAIIRDVRARIDPGKSVRVVGYSDNIGATDHNRRLSEQRARTVAEALGFPAVVGQDRLLGALFANELPEGRMYNRRVDITISR